MELTGNTILITGGSSGIGMALAERFVELGNEVIVTGRNQASLAAFKERNPSVHIRVSDAGSATDRVELAAWVMREFPQLNVLINNAGVQRRLSLQCAERWADTAQEIEINLGGPIHLSMLLIPQLQKQARAQLLNVSSGLAFVPLAQVPVYCATKAALHSFTLSLREQLRGTSIQVIEVIPPAVRTNLGGAHDFGEPLSDYVASVFRQLATDAQELTYGMSARASQLSRSEADQMLRRMNSSGDAAPAAAKP